MSHSRHDVGLRQPVKFRTDLSQKEECYAGLSDGKAAKMHVVCFFFLPEPPSPAVELYTSLTHPKETDVEEKTRRHNVVAQVSHKKQKFSKKKRKEKKDGNNAVFGRSFFVLFWNPVTQKPFFLFFFYFFCTRKCALPFFAPRVVSVLPKRVKSGTTKAASSVGVASSFTPGFSPLEHE